MPTPTPGQRRRIRLIAAAALFSCFVMASDLGAMPKEKLGSIFRYVDVNSDGTLTVEEVRAYPKLKMLHRAADGDGDGRMTLEEMLALVGKLRDDKPGDDGAGEADGPLRPGEQLRAVDVANRARRYLIYVPEGYDPERPAPVVLAFHGGGGNPRSMARLSGLNDKADKEGFIVVYPYGSGVDPDRNLTFNAGNVGGYAKRKSVDDVAFTKALIADLKEAGNIDVDRIFATGMSNGAMMAYRIASELSESIAAVAPVGGPMGTGTCDPAVPVSVMHFHGTADKLAPYEGGRGAGAPGVPAAARPEFYSVDHSIRQWVKANGCDAEPVVQSLADAADDGTRVVRKTWSGGKRGAEVVLVRIEGGGHTWPGAIPPKAFLGKSTRDISANDLMWEFFQKHARKADRPPSKQKAPENGAMELLRTPDERFANLRDYPFEPRYLRVDDPNLPDGNRRIRMHYAVSGPANRPTLLMLHGNPSWSYLFRKVVPLINEAGYRTIMIDYVGHGKSDKPAKESDYTYDRHLEWIRQAFKQLDKDVGLALKEVVIFGHDYGHPLGVRLMAEHFPKRFDGFINCNAGLNRGTRGIATRHQRWRNFVRSVERVPVGAVICRNKGRAKLGLRECPDEVVAGYDAPYPSGDYQASIRAFPEMVPESEDRPEAQANQRAWEFLTRFQRPYMVIWENWDMPDARHRRDEYIAAIPGAFGHEQPQLTTSHYAPEDEPEAVAAAVVRFLDDIYRTPAFRPLYLSSFSRWADGFVAAGDGAVYHAANRALAVPAAPDAGAAVTLQRPLDISGATEVKIAFRFVSEGLAATDQLVVELGDGAKWVEVLALKRGADRGQDDFTNGSTDYGYVRLRRTDIPFTEAVQLRFRCRGVGGHVYIKELGVYALGR